MPTFRDMANTMKEAVGWMGKLMIGALGTPTVKPEDWIPEGAPPPPAGFYYRQDEGGWSLQKIGGQTGIGPPGPGGTLPVPPPYPGGARGGLVPGGGNVTVLVTVQGLVTAGEDLAEMIREELLRIGVRNTTTGV